MRRSFLLALGGLGGTALAPRAAVRAGSDREIGLLTTHVVSEADPVLARTARALAVGSPLALRRSPQDRYDRRAVQAWTREGTRLGRVAPIDAKALASLMDCGLRTRARVISVSDHPIRPDIRIEVQVVLT